MKRFDTNTIDVMILADQLNRGDYTDLMLQGQLLNQNNLNLAPGGMDIGQLANQLTLAEMVTVGRSFELALSQDLWTGTVAAGTFPGLDSQIATGQVDATTNVACTSLDSDVKDFGWNDVCGTTLDITKYVTMLYRYLRHRAMGAGLYPVDWVWVMRPQLWDALSDCWPCRTMASNCTSFNQSTSPIAINVNDMSAYDERVRMRQGMILPVDGTDMPVVTDTGIYEYAAGLGGSGANLKSGEYASSIYLVPLAIPGMSVTYMNYKNYNNSIAQLGAVMRQLVGDSEIAVTDNGKFGWAKSKGGSGFCFKFGAVTEQRVILRTPWLAGKLQHVKYSPLQHTVEPDPTSVYNKDGGASLRGLPSANYHVWS